MADNHEMQWFGEPWGRPINKLEHVPTPIGHPCFHCHKPIEEEAQGVLLVCAIAGQPPRVPFHLKCLLETMGLEENTPPSAKSGAPGLPATWRFSYGPLIRGWPLICGFLTGKWIWARLGGHGFSALNQQSPMYAQMSRLHGVEGLRIKGWILRRLRP